MTEQDKIDPTFMDFCIHRSSGSTFGVEIGKNKGKAASGGGANISKKDMEILIEKAANTAPAQTIRIEQAPMVLTPSATPKKG